jgi:hypothetical protein
MTGVTEWQPIKTAPKTGVSYAGKDIGPMLLLAEGDTITIGFWNGSAWDDGDWNSNMHGFTHWMQLPEPPKRIRTLLEEGAVRNDEKESAMTGAINSYTQQEARPKWMKGLSTEVLNEVDRLGNLSLRSNEDYETYSSYVYRLMVSSQKA